MTTDELMQMAAEKAAKEVSEESLEFLFRPQNGFELMCRIDLLGMKQLFREWIRDDSPSAMPHRHRPPYYSQMKRVIELEEFYRQIKAILRPELREKLLPFVEDVFSKTDDAAIEEDAFSPPYGHPITEMPTACGMACGRKPEGDAEFCSWCGRWVCPEHRRVTKNGWYKCSECGAAKKQGE